PNNTACSRLPPSCFSHLPSLFPPSLFASRCRRVNATSHRALRYEGGHISIQLQPTPPR
ncbi:hypothetical protein BD626DRAFT_635228, partial [Schizophyllum amplum]